jgi:predicted glutamine amidotransferase
MCRLVGYVTRGPATGTDVLNGSFASFVELSHHHLDNIAHGDGWGLAWYDDKDKLHVRRKPQAAYRGGRFHHAAGEARSDAVIGHLRWASPGLALCTPNTHPFRYKNIAFAHNGGISPIKALEQFVEPALRGHLHGATDSERYFFAVASAMKRMPPEEALASVIRAYHERRAAGELSFSCLNCLMLTRTGLYAVCDFTGDAPMTRVDPDYYGIYYRQTRDAVVIGSSGWESGGGWKRLGNGHILVVERHTLRTRMLDMGISTATAHPPNTELALQR